MPAIYLDRAVKDNLPERHPRDFYPTPIELCRAAVQLVGSVNNDYPRILDPGAGTGVWGKACRERWPDAFIIGVENNPEFERKPAEYDFWVTEDYLQWDPYFGVDIVIGNPPYGRGAGRRDAAAAFIEHSMSRLSPRGGELLFLLRTEFQNSKRGAPGGLFDRYPPYGIYPLVQRPSFDGRGTQPVDYSLYYWRYQRTECSPITEWRPFSWR